jgi:hypothetical protein
MTAPPHGRAAGSPGQGYSRSAGDMLGEAAMATGGEAIFVRPCIFYIDNH